MSQLIPRHNHLSLILGIHMVEEGEWLHAKAILWPPCMLYNMYMSTWTYTNTQTNVLKMKETKHLNHITPSLAALNAKQGHSSKKIIDLMAQWGHQGDGEPCYNDPVLRGGNESIKSFQKEKGKKANFRRNGAFEGKGRQIWTPWHFGKPSDSLASPTTMATLCSRWRTLHILSPIHTWTSRSNPAGSSRCLWKGA